MDLTTLELNTARLLLVPLNPDFAEDIFREFTAEITRYMCPRPPERLEDTLQFIRESQRNLDHGLDLTLAILHRESRVFLGCLGLHGVQSRTPEFGIWLKKSAHGNGYGREAVAALKEWADTHLYFRYLIYPVDERNGPSRRIPESLGGVIARRYEQTGQQNNQLFIVEYRLHRPTPGPDRLLRRLLRKRE